MAATKSEQSSGVFSTLLKYTAIPSLKSTDRQAGQRHDASDTPFMILY